MLKHTTNNEVILRNQSDWELWIYVIKRIAEAGDVWEYINPDQPHRPLTRPEKPNKPTVATLATSPTESDGSASATLPIAVDLTQYKIELDDYYRELKDYRRLKDKFGQVEAHITKTIDQALLYHIKDKSTVYEQLKTLQELYSPTTVDQEFRVQTAYENAKVFHARQTNIEDWSNTFLTAYNRATQLELPEVHGFRPHKDVVRAIKQVEPAYAANISLEIFKAEETWNKDRKQPIPHQSMLSTILSDFLRYYRTTKSRKVNIHGGVFGATLNGQDSPYKRKRTRDEKATKPCLCGDVHFWGQCPYIDPSIRQTGFVEDPEKAKKIAVFESKDKEGRLNKIREKNRRYKKQKKQVDNGNDSDSIVIDAGDYPAHSTMRHEAYAVHLSAFSPQSDPRYPLLHSWTLDPATDIHICNNVAEFQWKSPASEDDIVLAGGSEVRIEAWGEVTIPLNTPNGTKLTTLKHVALIPSFFTSLVSLARLSSSNIHFDSGRNQLYKLIGSISEPIAYLTRIGGHWLVQHRSHPPCSTVDQQSAPYLAYAVNNRRPQYSALPRQPIKLTKPQLHLLMGHAGSDAIDHLANNVVGIEPPEGGAPMTINCEECSQNKAHQIISRRIGHERGASRPFETVAIDIIKLDERGYNGHKYVFHGFDLFTKFNFVYTIPKKDKDTLLKVLTRLDRAIKREFNQTVTFVIADDERGYGLKGDSVREYCQQEGISFQIRSPHTKEQNGSAERSGKNLIDRSRSMRFTSNLPLALSPEIYVSAGYLLNRTPTRAIGWKTPFEMAYKKKPSIAHMKIFGCRAYALRQQIPRGDKLTPRALIGYLVGYDASNVYRIWLPNARSRAHQGKVIRTRDVTFKENHFYQDINDSESVLQGAELEEIVHTINMPTLQDPEESSEDEFENIPHPDQSANVDSNTASSSTAMNQGIDQMNVDETPKSISRDQTPHPLTPATTISPHLDPSSDAQFTQPSSATLDTSLTLDSPSTQTTLAASAPETRKRKRDANFSSESNSAPNRELIDSTPREAHILPEGSKRSRKPSSKVRKSNSFFVHKYWSTYVAAINSGFKTRFHRSQLPTEPRFYQDVMKLPSPHREGFLKAMGFEIQTIQRKGTYKKLSWKDFDAQNNEVLPLIWVFKYKFDGDGFLTKYKARICVRGDLQTTANETHAATLAIRIFRALMAIAAYFNLEIRQYDAVNAFTNARLSTLIYCHPPDGFSEPDHLWELHRALYGLKTSPLLWYKELTKSLKELGLEEVTDVPCLWKNDKLLVFFYVDDIVILARPGHLSAIQDFERKLLQRYEIRSLGDLDTFCGIQIKRDRESGEIWLSQAAYVDQMTLKYPSPKSFNRPPTTPLPFEELLPSPSGEPRNEANIHRFAQLVGSIGYIAGATRPDIAKAHSKLAEFLINPSPQHIHAAYQTLAYLNHTKHQSLHYNSSISTDASYIVDHEEPDFYGATDASYADHKSTRKSSQGYIFFLFGGPIDWKATLQRCVTKSTTEAELIAASSAGTELIWWWRIFKAIDFDPNNEQILYCDNQQTIRLVTAATPKLKTSLRHVDIHHHWLRQEVQENKFNLSYIQTKSQPADGLTKLLPRQRHEHWVSLLRFTNFPSS